MIPYFIAAIVFIRLFIGFQYGDLDWMLPWYGLKPKVKKEKLPGKKIMNFASYMSLVAMAATFGKLYAVIFENKTLENIMMFMIIVPIILTVIYTYKWSKTD